MRVPAKIRCALHPGEPTFTKLLPSGGRLVQCVSCELEQLRRLMWESLKAGAEGTVLERQRAGRFAEDLAEHRSHLLELRAELNALRHKVNALEFVLQSRTQHLA
jgi:hypothetical protein